MRGSISVLSIALLVTASVLVGCGGHSSQAPPAPGPGEATFVGQAVCVGCHADIGAEYAMQVHGGVKYGGDFRNKGFGGQNVITGFGGGCQACHTVGYGEPSGFNPDGTTPHLEGIGCEECHGPGGNHAQAPSASNIDKVPQSDETCRDCHGESYKQLDGIVAAVQDADLAGNSPASVSIHHPQSPFLAGVRGFDMPDMPSPHGMVENRCVGCHLNPLPSSVGFESAAQVGGELDHGEEGLAPDAVTCAACHGGQSAAVATFHAFEEEMEETLIELAGEDPANPGHPDESFSGGAIAAFAAAHGINMADNANPDDPAVRKLKAAKYCAVYVMNDGSSGAHNPPFAEKLLAKARELLGLP